MIASWVAGLVVTAGLLALAARAAEAVLRSYGRATRWMWAAALAGSVVLPALGPLSGGRISLSWLPVPASSLDLAGLLNGAATATAELPGAAPAAAESSSGLVRSLAAGWAAASLAVLAVYGATWRRLRRSRREWTPGRVDGTAVYVSERGGPAVVGVLRPTIVVPEWLLDEREPARRMVLLHEREHVRARDPALLAAAPLLAAAMPWNVPLWWQLRRLRLAVELDCDRRVLAHGVEPGAYGTLLLDIAGRGGPPLVGAAAIAEPRTFLERRILAMSSTIPRLRLPRSLALTSAAGVLALFACETAAPTNVNLPEPRTATTETSAASAEEPITVSRSTTGTPLILVDGIVVTDDVMREIDPGTIDRIEVIKGQAAYERYGEPGRDGVIEIFTKEGRSRTREREKLEQAQREKVSVLAVLERDKQPAAEAAKREVVVRALTEAEAVVAEKRESAAVLPLKIRADVASVEGRATTSAAIGERQLADRPAFYIDGVLATKADVDRLEPKSIGSIEVLKGNAAAAAFGVRAVIRITTKR